MAERPRAPKLSTLAIRAGSTLTSRAAPITPAIHVAAVSTFEDAEALDRSMDGEDFVYARISSQNGSLLEEAVAALEGAAACAAYPSGMAAMKAVFEAQAFKPGDRLVIPEDGYGASRALYKALGAARQVEVVSLDLAQPESLARLATLKPRLVLAESLSNPLLSVVDIPALAAACRKAQALLAVDATFVSPILQQPLAMGADYVIHSTTKWINGHSDALGGVVSGALERIAVLKAARVLDGAVLGPFEAWLTLRGLRTLPVRMAAHCANAARVSVRLAESPLLDRVIYPGRVKHPQHEVAKRVLQGGFGGMVAFEIAGAAREHAFRFLESVRIARPAPSLGDVATLVMHAASASARRMTPEERATAGIRENLIRVSVGLEDPDEIAEDLLQAVARAMGSAG